MNDTESVESAGDVWRSVWRRRDIAVCVVLYFVVLIAGVVVIGVMSAIGLFAYGSNDVELMLELVVSVAASLSAVGVPMLLRGLSLADVGLAPLPPTWLWKGVVLAIALVIVRSLLSAGLLALFPWIEIGVELIHDALVPDGALARVVVFILGCFVVPVGEELLFRGVVFGAIRARRSFWRAALISSLLFGAFHIIPLQAILAAVLGVALCWAYERTHSLTVAVLIHMVNNMIAFGLTFASLPFLE